MPNLDNDTSYTLLTSPTLTDQLVMLDKTAGVVKKMTLANLFKIIGIASDGTMMNGKLSVTVASNNLTVALKTYSGNDPSSTDPVVVKIGGAVRTITSALSVTAAAGTAWCAAGAAPLATKEVDYFAYLGYNATDGVVIGFSRLPGAALYSDFSTTSTIETFCKISTITNAAATDNYVCIGRFAATLSAGAGYTWTVPTFTAKNLIQRPCYETRWLALNAPTFTVAEIDNGSGAQPTTTEYRYRLFANKCDIHIRGTGTKAGTNAYFSFAVAGLPITIANTSQYTALGGVYLLQNGGTSSIGIAEFQTGYVYFVFSASITDNVVIDGWGSTIRYEY